METLKTSITRVRYHQANFAIVEVTGGHVVRGPLMAPRIGLEYVFRGAWINDPKWGKQFVAEEYDVALPTTTNGVARYLEESCPGIGPVVARRLIDAYGDAALETLKQAPEKIAKEIPGLTLERARRVAESLRDREHQEQLMVSILDLLGGTKVSRSAVRRILKKWDKDAANIIRENPYQLTEIDGVGFLAADDVARRIGIPTDSPMRIRAGLLHVLDDHAFGSGHVYLPREILIGTTAGLLQVEAAKVAEKLGRMCETVEEERDVVADGPTGEPPDCIYLASLHAAETAVAEKLAVLMQSAPRKRATVALDGLADDQVEAVEQVVLSPVSVITGGPGTGKTWTIKRLIDSFPGAIVELAAPTGKAAKRIQEQTGRPAQTIHRLLEPKPDAAGRFKFSRNWTNPIPADLIVLDEVSMVDISLMRSFIDAVAPGTRLILVGDSNQLPAVGPGSVLAETILSGVVPSVELSKIKRQDAGDIIQNCHRVKNGIDIVVSNRTSRDFFFLEHDAEEDIMKAIVYTVTRRLPASYKIDPLRDLQVISPMREKTALGCAALNAALRQAIVGVEPGPDAPRFVTGDKVIQTRNDYGLGIINGDIGYVVALDREKKTVAVAFESPPREVDIPLGDCNLELAYAVTCHKFQGSEARVVVVPAHRCFGPKLYQRNWIYTAISRAREVFVFVGQRAAVAQAISRNQQVRRFTRLAELIRAQVPPQTGDGLDGSDGSIEMDDLSVPIDPTDSAEPLNRILNPPKA